MKRALAERAKQSANGLTSGSATQQPPHKMPKVEPVVSRAQQQPSQTILVKQSVSNQARPPSPPPSSSSHARTPVSPPRRGRPPNSSRSSKNSLKRQRTNASGEEDEMNSNSTFFLKHQNSALASELKQLQYQMHLLQTERDYRREQCHQANESLHTLEATWNSMEVALQLGQEPSAPNKTERGTGEYSITEQTPTSTGTGESVELIGELLNSLAALGGDEHSPTSEGGNSADSTQQQKKQLSQMNKIAKQVTQRATVLQRWIWALLRKATKPDDQGKYPVLKAAKFDAKLSLLKAQLREQETRIKELAKSRDDATSSEKKVRRGLYRLSSGRMNLSEVLKSIECDQDGALLAEELPAPSAATTATDDDDGEMIDNAQVAKLRKKLQDTEEVAGSRESQIQELLKERDENLKRINTLSLSNENSKSRDKQEITEDDIKRSELYLDTWTKLMTSERQMADVRGKLNEVTRKWSQSKGDAEHARKSLEDILSKHRKRWAELTDTSENGNGETTEVKKEVVMQAEKIAELEHKLQQALANVRQADAVRQNFEEATKLNDALQSKLDETKAKNVALIANAKQLAASRDGNKTPSKSTESGELTAEKIERLQKDHRRLRKELAAATQSKESARAKLERCEKERDSMSKMNARLLKQSAEKDEMNAKSLSTILQLKEQKEKLEKEKDLIEQEHKSAGQVGLASRLVSNAKDRVSEEIFKEKKELEVKISQLEQNCEHLKQDKEQAIGNLEKKKAEMSDLEKTASTAKDRCDELVNDASKQEEDKRRLMESLAVAKREASAAAKNIAKLKASGGGGSGSSGFTTAQLETQIRHLKSRIVCPVCNDRDKKCIVMRCKHMFCRQCIDENIRNRSRKCPACKGPFDKKDVEEIWL